MALNDNSYQAGENPHSFDTEQENQQDEKENNKNLNNGSFSTSKNNKGEPLTIKEKVEVEELDKIAPIVTGGVVPPGVVKTIAKEKPDEYRKIKSSVKRNIIITIVSSILPLFMVIIFITAIIATIVVAIKGVNDAHAVNNVTPTAKISAENFYGVRILYKNNELANKNLTTTYNQLVFEFLQTVSSSEIEGIESLNINLPSNIYEGDLTSYQTPLTIDMVYKTVESVLNSQGLLEPVVVNGENFEQSLSQINNFGFNETSFVSATSSITTLFKEKVQASLEDADESNNLVTFSEGVTALPSDFETMLSGLWAGENFNKFKISTEKLFVKDVILSKDENSLNTAVNGNVVKYIYMAKEGAVLSEKDYGMKVEPGEEYNIAFKTIVNGEESVIKQDIANETWCSLEEDGNYYYSKQLYLENINITCPEFTSLDSANLNFLNKDNFSLYNAGFTSLDSTGKCFTVAQTEGETDYYTINSNLTCDCAFVEITPISQTSTNYTFSEIY